MSNYLPDGCTQDMLDRALDQEEVPEDPEREDEWWDEEEKRDV